MLLSSAWQGYEMRGILTASRNVKWYSFSQDLNTLTIVSSNYVLGHLLKEDENLCPHKCWHLIMYCSIYIVTQTWKQRDIL